MKFRSPTELPIHLALTSGHTFVIGAEPVDVPNQFLRHAVTEGCIAVGAELPPDLVDIGSAGTSKRDVGGRVARLYLDY